MERHARHGWFINDLHRHPLPYHGFRLLARVMGWHRFVQHDGQVSIARAFKRRGVGAPAGPGRAGTRRRALALPVPPLHQPPPLTPVLVVGGGLAGAAAASILAEAGRPVTVLERDRAPAHKICGEFLSGEALADLARARPRCCGVGRRADHGHAAGPPGPGRGKPPAVHWPPACPAWCWTRRCCSAPPISARRCAAGCGCAAPLAGARADGGGDLSGRNHPAGHGQARPARPAADAWPPSRTR